MNVSYVNFGVAMEAQLALAREERIVRPTLMFLDPASAAARAIFEEACGEPLLPTEIGGEACAPLLRVSREAAQRLLRRHAGEGGDAVARHLATEVLGADYWIVVALTHQLAFRAMKEHVVLAGGELSYDPVPRLRRTMEETLNDDGPSMVTLRCSSGTDLRICGPTGADAVLAATLVGMATSCPGWADLPDPVTGKLARVWVNEDLVVDFLSEVFGQNPKAVAEAVMALRKADGARAAWLERLLRNRPCLKGLSDRVRHELTGL